MGGMPTGKRVQGYRIAGAQPGPASQEQERRRLLLRQPEAVNLRRPRAWLRLWSGSGWDWGKFASAVTALTAIAALLFTALSLQQTRSQNQLAQSGQITDRFNAAVTNLGSETMTIRIGGIFGLQRIMQDSPRDQPAAVQVLAAYVRQRAPRPSAASAPTAAPAAAAGADAPPAIDVQTALTVLAARDPSHDQGSVIDLSDTDLSAANLIGANLGRADLTGAILTGADLRGARLSFADLNNADLNNADLSNADLSGARLRIADLSGAGLDFADLHSADLYGANLGRVNLVGADLSGASLSYVKLVGAHLNTADLGRAHLIGADLVGADLSAANLSYADLVGAIGVDLDGADQDLNGPDLYGTLLSGAPYCAGTKPTRLGHYGCRSLPSTAASPSPSRS